MPSNTISAKSATVIGNFANKHLLRPVEWIAETAYVPPGFHRLFTATGLTIGLLTGRQLMNVVCARHSDGSELKITDVPLPLRPLYGLMPYNPYSDDPQDKWRNVVNHMTPAVLGAAGSVYGSEGFFRYRHVGYNNLMKEMSGGAPQFVETADYLSNVHQSRFINVLAGLNFELGSSTGLHLFPNPLSSMATAIRFQMGSGKKINLPGMDGITGNRGGSINNSYYALNDMVGFVSDNARYYMEDGATGHLADYIDRAFMERKARASLQFLKDLSPSDTRKFNDEVMVPLLHKIEGAITEMRAKGTTDEDIFKAVNDMAKKELTRGGLENKLFDTGILTKDNMHQRVTIGDNGVLSWFSRLIGAGKKMDQIEKTTLESMAERQAKRAETKAEPSR